MIKIGSEFLRKTNNKETMQILEVIWPTSLDDANPFLLPGELFWQHVFSLLN